MNRAILVREKIGRLVGLLTEKSIEVTQRGSNAYVKYAKSGQPSVLNIPYISDDASDEFLDAIEGFVDHEVAHVLFSDYKSFDPAKKGGVAKLHNVIEDSFIERKMAASFSGSAYNLGNVASFFLKKKTDKYLKENPERPEDALLVPAVRAMAGQTVFVDYMKDKWHLIDHVMSKIGDYAKVEIPKAQNSFDCVRIALEIKRLLDKPAESESDDEGDDADSSSGDDKDDSEEEGDKDSDKKPAKGKKTAKEEKKEPEEGEEDRGEDELKKGGGDGEGDGEEDSEETPESESSDEPEGGEDETAGEKPGSSESEGGKDKSDKLSEGDGKKSSETDWDSFEKSLGDYDESLSELLGEMATEEMKSSKYNVYTRDFDVIEPMKLDGDDALRGERLKSMQNDVDHMIAPLQKDLERAVAARSAATFTAGHRSGKLHASALAKLTMFKDERAFRRKHVASTKDVAVSLLVDCSGSMQNGGKIETAAYAAYGLASVLDRMNISSEVLGFTTLGAMPYSEMRAEEKKSGIKYARVESLYIPIIKGFNERLSVESKQRFAQLPQVGWLRENVDGECVQIAAARLSQRRESRKILIVLSDGQPACPGDHIALRNNLKSVVGGIEKSGIDVLGIGINSSAVSSFYSKSVVLDNVKDLPTTVIGQIKKLLMQN